VKKSKGLLSILILLLLAVIVSAARAEILSIPVEVRDGAVFVSVRINANNVTLLLDTGASNTIVDPKAVGVAEAGLVHSAFLAEGHTNVSVAVIKLDLQIGKAKFIVPVVMDKLTVLQTRFGNKVQGLLGNDVLTQFKSVTISYQTKTLELSR